MKRHVAATTVSARIAWLASSILAGFAIFFVAVSFSQAGPTELIIQAAKPRAVIRGLQTNERGVSFTLQTPVLSSREETELRVAGLDVHSNEPGHPSLPYFTTFVAIPPGAQARLKLSQPAPDVRTNIALPLLREEVVYAQPMPGGDDLNPPGVQPLPQLTYPASHESELPRSSDLYPEKVIDISEPMMFRDIRLVRVSLFPLRYDSQSQLLVTSPELNVSIEFEQAEPQATRRPAPSYADQHLSAASKLVINPDQLGEFRSLPSQMTGAGTTLPLGRDLFKISIQADGIYQITYADLAAAGMDLSNVDPATIEMMYRGSPIATRFQGNTNDEFEPGESILFYGFDFDGSRLEKQFVAENIFWLWAGGVSHPMSSKDSTAGVPVTATRTSLTHEPENEYWQGYTADWPENEPDAWYWKRFTAFQTPVTNTFTVTLPHPAEFGPQAAYTAEFGSYDGHTSDQTHHITATMNGQPGLAQRTWNGDKNFNVSASIPQGAVIGGENTLEVAASTEGFSVRMVLNRITVDYDRLLIAENDQLIFPAPSAGQHKFTVREFDQADPKQILIWDISDPYSPAAIHTSTLAISGSGPYSVTFGAGHEDKAEFIATTYQNVGAPPAISRYVAPQLDPPAGADWVAIAYQAFLIETARLAAHRAQPKFGGLVTHVVDIEDIVNQYGYGLPVPAAVQDYLTHAIATWPVKPSYVTLIGDATQDPRRLNSDWPNPQYTPTDLVFLDRWSGQLPSDLTFALLSGDDILPDLAVGRIAVSTGDELAAALDKIIRYDENQLLSFGWMQNLLFVADDTDPDAGYFCYENEELSRRLPKSLNNHLLCLDDYDVGNPPDGEEIRNDMLSFLADQGATVVNYRGHGSVGHWGGTPVIFALANVSELSNQQPFVAVSADCLDGNYAYPAWEGLGERLISNQNFSQETTGAAAHWGSSGLGLSSDHTTILNGFYDGVFSAEQTALGDAVNYAKIAFAQGYNIDPAILYSFNLQGDPAMHLMRPNLRLEGEWQQDFARPGDQASLSLELQNLGVYPAPVKLIGDVPPGLTISSVTSTVTSTLTISGDSAEIALQFGSYPNSAGIPRNGVAGVTVTYDVAPDTMLGPVNGYVAARGGGLDAWPGDETMVYGLAIVEESGWLPALKR